MAVNFNILVLTINECNWFLKTQKNTEICKSDLFTKKSFQNIIVENIRFKIIIDTKKLKLKLAQ